MDELAVTILTITTGVLFVWALTVSQDYRAAAERLSKLQFANPYARLLGRVVEAKVYEGSDWERMLVVAVSWHGSVAVRPVRDLSTKARWIHKSKVPTRVREIADEHGR